MSRRKRAGTSSGGAGGIMGSTIGSSFMASSRSRQLAGAAHAALEQEAIAAGRAMERDGGHAAVARRAFAAAESRQVGVAGLAVEAGREAEQEAEPQDFGLEGRGGQDGRGRRTHGLLHGNLRGR